jgi:hypothetical protein
MGLESGLPFGLQCVPVPCLVDTVGDHENSKWALFALAFGMSIIQNLTQLSR